MTGFGKGETTSTLGTATIEVRSVNHRYFEMQAHLPNHFAVLEDRLRERLKKHVKRGRLTFSLTFRRRGGEVQAITIDTVVARRYHVLLMRLKSALRLQGEVTLAQLLGLPKVVTVEEPTNRQAALARLADRATDLAAKRLVQMRRTEGQRLARVLLEHVRTIEGAVRAIEERAPQVVAAHRERLTKRLQALLQDTPVDQQRVATEVAVFADTHDISEETARVRSHLAAIHQVLRNGDEAGRTLDFLAQELFREANTIGSKAADTAVTALVITMKGAIEKLREQVQNIE